MKKLEMIEWVLIISGILFLIWGIGGWFSGEVYARGGIIYSRNTDAFDFYLNVIIYITIGLSAIGYVVWDRKRKAKNLKNDY